MSTVHLPPTGGPTLTSVPTTGSADPGDPADPADPAAAAAKSVDEVPGPAAGAGAAIRRLRADPLAALLRLRAEHGPIVRLSRWPVSLFLVADPDAVADALVNGHRAYAKGAVVRGVGQRSRVAQPLALLLGEGLLTSAGAKHKRQRRLIQPLFHKRSIAAYGEVFAGTAAEFSGRWLDGQRIDVHAEMTEMTLAIVARTLFDVDLDSEVVDVVRAAVASNMPMARRAAMPGMQRLEKLPLPAARRRAERRDALDRTVIEMIAARRAAGGEGGDLLSLLLSARDADTGERMADSEIRDEALTLLLAGHETTANALTWTFHLLGSSPEVGERLVAELDQVVGQRRPTIDDLPRLPYASAVFSESMRLYPPVWTMGRHLIADRVVGGYLLPAGSTLILSQWVLHRDQRWWPDPERFSPERWLPDTGASAGAEPARPRFAYFPFGAGPRQCIGNTFALAEGILALATIAQRWSFTPVAGVPIVPVPMVTLRPRDGLPMIANRR
jgi:cytochrome P450